MTGMKVLSIATVLLVLLAPGGTHLQLELSPLEQPDASPIDVRVEVDGEEHTLGPGGLVHVESTTPRRLSNASETEDLVLLVIGGKDGYVERDGHMVDEADIERRASFGS